MSVPRAAMILAAGRGERMLPLTRGRAKPTLPVLGLPILARILRFLEGQGVRDVAVNAINAAESIGEVLDRHAVDGLSTELFLEKTLMGSGGAFAAPSGLLGAHESFVVHNGDTLVDAPLDRLTQAAHQGRKRLGALLVREGRSPLYRPVRTKDGLFRGVGDADEGDGSGEELATYLGVAILRREVLSRVPADRPSSLFEDVLLPLLAEGAELAVVRHSGRWLEFTSPGRYVSSLTSLLQHARRSGRVELPGGDAPVVPTDSGALFLAGDAVVETGASVAGALVLERGARVRRGGLLCDCVLLEGASVTAGVFMQRVAVEAGLDVDGPRQHRDGTLSHNEDAAEGAARVSFHAARSRAREAAGESSI
ncbi:MAG: NDP-sugar synthase [Acidobacteriota bacterium]|nr:NDP-sugar synthase [Acidobacteriota bacterium]